jgi:hypothetical protein
VRGDGHVLTAVSGVMGFQMDGSGRFTCRRTSGTLGFLYKLQYNNEAVMKKIIGASLSKPHSHCFITIILYTYTVGPPIVDPPR